MSSKNLLPAYKLESSQSLASDFSTDPVTITTLDNVGFTVVTSSVTDNTGTFTVEVRIYKDANNYSDWVALTLSSSMVLADDDASFFVNLNQLPPVQVRISFVAAGGTPDGTVDIWVSGCEL